jgi:hypothetical protein
MTTQDNEMLVRLARLEERVEGMRISTQVAKEEIDRRLDEMNMLRRQIESERGAYVDIARYEERHEDLGNRLTSLENRVAVMEGGNTIKAGTISWGIAGLGVVITVVVIIVNVLTGSL